MNGNRLRLAVFDVDGTLVDSLAAIVRSMAGAAEIAGLAAPDPSVVRGVVGLPLLEAVARVFPEAPAGLHPRLAQGYKDTFWTQHESDSTEEALFPGMTDVLDRVEATGALLGIATGKGRRGLDAVLERHGLAGRFVTLQTGDVGPGKPHPDMLHRAIAECGVEAQDTVMIGDTTFDIAMARAAGVTAIGVAWGYHAVPDLHATGADYVAERTGDLPALIERGFGRAVPR